MFAAYRPLHAGVLAVALGMATSASPSPVARQHDLAKVAFSAGASSLHAATASAGPATERRSTSPALANGYRDGYDDGRDDARHSRTFDPARSPRYRSADHDYDRRFGSRDEYKQEYRTGFQQGYQQGYRESRR
jgi:flagellar biosynthesis/type III secretory pathway protein FliH